MTFEWKHPKYYAELMKLRKEEEAKEEEKEEVEDSEETVDGK